MSTKCKYVDNYQMGKKPESKNMKYLTTDRQANTTILYFVIFER